MPSEALSAFSIILPVYNGQHVVERCIISIIEQNHTLFELLIIDDGSTDQTHEVCKKYYERDSRVRYYKQNNKGVSAARNHGLRAAQNEYLLFVDADDYLLPNFLQAFNNLLASNSSKEKIFIFQDFIADIRLADGRAEQFKWCKFSYAEYTLKETFMALDTMNWLNWGVPFAKIYRRSIILDNHVYFNEHMSFREDLIFMLEYIAHVDKLVFDPTANYYYTIDNTKKSLSNTTASFDNEIIFFNYSKQMTDFYINKYKLENSAQLVLYKMVYASLFRCINSCMYKYKSPMKKDDRIKNIKLLATKDNLDFLLKSGIINTKSKYLAFALLRNKLYILYDLLNSMRFDLHS
jgi:glycosyltransferase involved in cell wall biosynthesis